MLRSFFIAAAAFLLVTSSAAAGTLDRIKNTGVMKIAYRTDAPPFSYTNSANELAGYTIALCQGVAAHIEKQLKLKLLTSYWHFLDMLWIYLMIFFILNSLV